MHQLSSSVGSMLSAPIPTGQKAQILGILRKHGSVLNVDLAIKHGFTQAPSRILSLIRAGFNIEATRHDVMEFPDRKRSHVVSYSLGSPEWPRPGFIAEGKHNG